MFWFNLFVVVLGAILLDARHVPLSAQQRRSPQSSSRFIVIRPPAGMGQGNRVIVLANPRFIPNSRTESPGRRTESPRRRTETPRRRTETPRRRPPVSPAVPRQLTRGPILRRTSVRDNIRTGSQRRQLGAGAGAGAGARIGLRTPSLRNILQRRRNQARARLPSTASNIARLSDTVPRALPPLTPQGKRFGELNMPSGIEMALNRLRQEAQQASVGRLRPPAIPNHRRRIGGVTSPHFGSGLLDLSGVQVRGNSRGSARASASLFSTDETRGKSKKSQKSIKGQESKTKQSQVSTTKKSQTITKTTKASATAVDKVVSKSATVSKSETVVADTTKTSEVKAKKSSAAKAGASASASVAVESAAKATNTTTSVKTKTIKVTTVVKGNNPAAVAAAKANQEALATAVANGGDIAASQKALAAAVASGGALPVALAEPTSPVGSISVHRSPDGVSTITLWDGQGDPVILRATGPVRIERVISPSGRIQFLVNPMPPPGEEVEIEPEDILTTTITPIAAAEPPVIDTARIRTIPQSIPQPSNPDGVVSHQTASLAGVQEHSTLSKTSVVQTVSKSATAKSEHSQAQAQTQSVGTSGEVVSATSKSQSAKSVSKQSSQAEHSHAQVQQSVGKSGQVVSSATSESKSAKSVTKQSAKSEHSHTQVKTSADGSGPVVSSVASKSHSAHAHSHSADHRTSRTETFIAPSPHHDPQGILHPNELAAIQRARARQQQSEQAQQAQRQQPPGPSVVHQHGSVVQGSSFDSHTHGGAPTSPHAHGPSSRDPVMSHSHSPSVGISGSPVHDAMPISPDKPALAPIQIPSHSRHRLPISGSSKVLDFPATTQSPRNALASFAADTLGSVFPSAEQLSKMFASNRTGVSALEFLAALESVQSVLSSLTASPPSFMPNTVTSSPVVPRASSIFDSNSQSPPVKMTTYSPFAPMFPSVPAGLANTNTRNSQNQVRQIDIAPKVAPIIRSVRGHRLDKHSGHIQANGPS